MNMNEQQIARQKADLSREIQTLEARHGARIAAIHEHAAALHGHGVPVEIPTDVRAIEAHLNELKRRLRSLEHGNRGPMQ